MTKFRMRFLIGLVTLIFIVLIGLGLIFGQLFKTYYLDMFDTRLNQESDLVASFIEETGGVDAISPRQMAQFSKKLKARISIMEPNGTLIYDGGQEGQAEQERHREMIQEILHQKKLERENDEVFEEDGLSLHYYWSPLVKNGESEGYAFLSVQLADINRAYQQIWWILIGCLGFALIFIIVLASRITARFTAPIESATNVAIELANGNYQARTYEERDDETGLLSSSINALARNLEELEKTREIQQERLGALIENIGSSLILIDSRGFINLINKAYKETFQVEHEDYFNKLYYEVIHDEEVIALIEKIFMTELKVRQQMGLFISEKKKHFDVYGVPIIGTNSVWKGVLLVFHDITEIKKLEQMRKDFVANVSHELKTPITSIKGFSETLLEGAMNDKDSLELFLNIILKESDRMENLIRDLLDLSKIEHHGFQLSIQKCNIIHLIEEVLSVLNEKAAEKSIHLHFEKSTDELFIDGDISRLKQVLINLITNAVIYTPIGGDVTISVDQDKTTASVSVKDTGIGIDKQEIPRIFERFYRVDKARSRNSGGTGLGLAIVKHIIEAHRGKISVESVKGKGTTFLIKLQKELEKQSMKK